MTDKYTPTTWEVRSAWVEFDGYISARSHYAEVARIEFDRWLSEVKAEAWAEGAYAGYDDCEFGREAMCNPYRLVDEDE